MKEKNKAKIALSITVPILSTILFILSIICLNLKIELDNSKFKYTYKLACVERVNTTIKSEKALKIKSYHIIVKNQSHTYTSYEIAYEKQDPIVYSINNEFSYVNNYDHLIDYNTGKVNVFIVVNARTPGNLSVNYSESFDCYTKADEEKINFYETEKSKEQMTFELNPLQENGFTKIKVNIEIIPKYELE